MSSEKSPSVEKVHTDVDLRPMPSPFYGDGSPSRWHNMMDSFKETEGEGLQQGISKRHLQMMAISTGTGTGLLVAASSKLASAGPAGLLVAYAVLGYVMLIPMIYCLSELSIAYPGLPGGFQSYSSKFIDESLGAALGWNYYLNWLVVVPLEIVTATMTIKFWTTTISPDAWVPIFIVFVTALQFSARVYGEAEYIMNMVKVLFICGFIIFGICVDAGASESGFIGAKYYHDPGAWGSGFKGFCTVFASGAFSLGGSEFISLSAAEVRNPTQAISSAIKFSYFKVTVFFLGSLIFVGLLVSSEDPQLLNSGSAATAASPFVLAPLRHGIKPVAHIANAVILISVSSVASAATYSTSRLLHSLAEQGLAPKWFTFVDRKGRPLRALLISELAMLFAFIAHYKNETAVFNWMLAISAVSFVLLWFFIGVIFIQWRRALKFNNISTDTLAYKVPFGEVGAILFPGLSIVINFCILMAIFWTGGWPKKGEGFDVTSWFQQYLGVIFFIVCYVGHKLWTRNWRIFKPLSEIDINKDRVIYDPEVLQLEKEETKQRFKSAPIWKKLFLICFD